MRLGTHAGPASLIAAGVGARSAPVQAARALLREERSLALIPQSSRMLRICDTN